MSLAAVRPAAKLDGTEAKAPLRKRPEVLAALSLTSLYFAVMSGHNYSIDGLLMYRQALSIVQNFSLRFQVPVHWGAGISTTSISGIGLPLLYVPGVALLTKVGVHVPVPTSSPYDWDLFYRDVVYAIGAAPVHILVTVATAYLVAQFVLALGYGTKTALFALASYGIGSPAIVYARGDFPQPELALWVMAGLLAALRYRASGSTAALVAAGASLVLAVLSRPVEGSFLLPALILMVVPNLNPREWKSGAYTGIAVIASSYVIAVAVTLMINWARLGSPFQTGYNQISWGTPVWVGLPGALISPARGIIWQFPLILLAPLGLWRLRLSPHRRVAAVMAFMILVLLLNTALWVPWWGAWSWGLRLFVPAWPVVAVLAAIGAGALRPSLRLWLPASLFVAGVVWAVPGTLTDLLGGYAPTYDGTAGSFLLSGYPPIGAWQFLHHLRATDLGDSSALDILWFRIARRTHDASMLVPLILAVAAAALAWMAVRAEGHLRMPRQPDAVH